MRNFWKAFIRDFLVLLFQKATEYLSVKNDLILLLLQKYYYDIIGLIGSKWGEKRYNT